MDPPGSTTINRGPCFPLFNHYFYKKLTLYIQIPNIYLGLGFEFGPQRGFSHRVSVVRGSEPVIFYRHCSALVNSKKNISFLLRIEIWALNGLVSKKSNKIQSRISCIFTINLICQTPLHCCFLKIAVNLIFPFTMRTIYIGLPLKMTLKKHQIR